MRIVTALLGLALLLSAIAGCGTGAQVAELPPAAVGTGLDLPLATTVPEGTWSVGADGDIPAGTYRTPGAEDSALPNCYWERLLNTSGEFSAIVANGNATGPEIVTLLDGEYFRSQGCLPWSQG